MADLSITAANVKPVGDKTRLERVKFGETVTPGQTVYLDSADRKHYKADADNTDATAEVVGIVFVGGGDDEYGFIIPTGGSMVIGATMAQGASYYQSDTAGGIKPEADLATGDRVVYLGQAETTTLLRVEIKNFRFLKT